MNFTRNYTDLIAALIGDILDSNYPEEFLAKHGLKVELTERTADEQIVHFELGKGKAARQFSIGSHRDIHHRWHHVIFGSLYELPIARQRQLHGQLDKIVAARIAEEEAGETEPKKPRPPRPRKTAAEKKTPPTRRTPAKKKTGEASANGSANKPPRRQSASAKKKAAEKGNETPAPKGKKETAPAK